MNFAEFAMFLANNCENFKVVGAEVAFGRTSFDQVSIFGATRTIVFSNPVVSLKITGVIHTEITELKNGLIELNILCKDELTGEEYHEEIYLSKS